MLMFCPFLAAIWQAQLTPYEEIRELIQSSSEGQGAAHGNPAKAGGSKKKGLWA